MNIVAVTGMPGSGKSVVARIIGGELGYPVYTMGDIVRDVVRKRGLELEPSNIEMVARELRSVHGKGVVARLLMESIDPGIEGIVADGVRSLEEIEVFEEYGPVCIVAVHSPPLTRFERMTARGRFGEAEWRAFLLRDMTNIEFGVGNVMAIADYMIVNTSSIEDLVDEARRIAWVISCDRFKGCGRNRGKAYRG